MSEQPALVLSYARLDDDETVELFADVQYLGFSGHSSAWFNAQELINYSKSLREVFPFSSDAPLKLEGRHWGILGTDANEVHLGLSFYPIGSAGLVGCNVKLLQDGRLVLGRETRNFYLNLEIHTSYEAVRKFSLAFDRVLHDETETAELASNP